MFKKIWICCCIIIMVLLFAQGTKRICSAYDFGKKAGDDFVTQQNGGDTETYNQIVSELRAHPDTLFSLPSFCWHKNRAAGF